MQVATSLEQTLLEPHRDHLCPISKNSVTVCEEMISCSNIELSKFKQPLYQQYFMMMHVAPPLEQILITHTQGLFV